MFLVAILVTFKEKEEEKYKVPLNLRKEKKPKDIIC